MVIHDPLTGILGSKVKVQCLRHLCNFPVELNGTQLSKFLHITPKSVHKAMSDLVNEGIVHLKPHGNSFEYSINKDHWVVQRILVPMFFSEKDFLEKVVNDIRARVERSPIAEHILSVVLFGSVHRREEQSRSDFDVFVLVDAENQVGPVEATMEDMGTGLLKSYGISFGPYVKSLGSFRKDKNLSVIRSILSSHSQIYGKSITQYVR